MRLVTEIDFLEALFYIGIYYKVKKDYIRAYKYFEKHIEAYSKHAIFKPFISSYENIAEMIWSGDEGVPLDYVKAVTYFDIAYQSGSNWGNDRHADLLINEKLGYTDYVKAKELLDKILTEKRSPLAKYLYGIIYGRGLGVKADLNKGVSYLTESNTKRARAELEHYKKNIFGKWRFIK